MGQLYPARFLATTIPLLVGVAIGVLMAFVVVRLLNLPGIAMPVRLMLPVAMFLLLAVPLAVLPNVTAEPLRSYGLYLSGLVLALVGSLLARKLRNSSR
jgi:hypothetical protein